MASLQAALHQREEQDRKKPINARQITTVVFEEGLAQLAGEAYMIVSPAGKGGYVLLANGDIP